MESPIRRALISVSDKRGLIDFARGLRDLDVEIVSTGGTARALREAGIPIVEIDAFTGFPEMLDGRVKTLHPRVHAGILHRRDDPKHLETMREHGLKAIDLVCVNLYPFEETVAKPGVTREEAVENIDIGGPSMVRSAAKNHDHVTVVSSPAQYDAVIADMRSHGGATTSALRRRLAREAFRRTATYDAAIARHFEAADREPPAAGEEDDGFPPYFDACFAKAPLTLRYGENPHQKAALYGGLLDRVRQHHGKKLSYNNIVDLVAAQEAAEWVGRRGPAVAIIKHTNPCGLAVGASAADAWKKALATDPVSASGAIIASSRPIDRAAAEAMGDHFIDILLAPGYEPAALELLAKKKNRIILEVKRPFLDGNGTTFRSVPGGALVQTADDRELGEKDWKVVTRRQPTAAEWAALRFGWDVIRFVKSNAILYCAEDRTLGVGAGQMSRVDSARIGAMKARDAGLSLKGCAVASDAFFPFPDGLVVAAEAGATAVIQPGGSIRDADVIAAADERVVAMVVTGARHFRH